MENNLFQQVDSGANPTSPLQIGKAWQRQIRERKEQEKELTFFNNPINVDIKKAELREVNYETAKTIIEEYEWLGTMGTTQFYYGIYFEGVCAGVVCFGFFQAMQGYAGFVGDKFADNGIQLSRGACVYWAHKHSGSKLISYGLKQMQKKGYKYVIAFSDPEAGEIGTLYQATNWFYLGYGNTTHYNIIRSDGKFFMNDRDFNKKYGFKTIKKFITDNNCSIKKVLPKARYIKLLGSKEENEEMMTILQSRILPYPKRSIT